MCLNRVEGRVDNEGFWRGEQFLRPECQGAVSGACAVRPRRGIGSGDQRTMDTRVVCDRGEEADMGSSAPRPRPRARDPPALPKAPLDRSDADDWRR